MSNFGFVRGTLPELHDDCARAESYLVSDPRSACVYARRAIEGLTGHLFDVLALTVPYRDDLAARINDAAFKAGTGVGITQKLNLIRNLGNTAVHEQRPIPPRAALDCLIELHHVMVWAAFRYSPHPGAVPTGARFDPKLAARGAALSQQEVAALARKFQAQDEAHARALAERDELARNKDAEIAELREKIKAAQAVNTRADDHDYSEAETRDSFIDLLLAEAGWPLTDPRDREYPVTGMPGSGTGRVDYVLWGADGLPLAVVEAKRTTKSVEVGQQQAKLYADCLERQFARRPVIFYTNGHQHRIWDDAAGYPPREIQGFHTRDELELVIQRRQGRQSLADAPSLTERLFEARLGLVRALDCTRTDTELRENAAGVLHEFVAGMNLDNVVVRGHRWWVERYADRAAWAELSDAHADGVRTHLSGLPSSAAAEEQDAKRFDLLMLGRRLAQHDGDALAAERAARRSRPSPRACSARRRSRRSPNSRRCSTTSPATSGGWT